MPQNDGPENLRGIVKPDADAKPLVQGHHHLMVIGIDEYRYCPPLYNAVQDARNLVDLLQEKFLFEAAHTRTFFNQEATEEAIFHALDELVNETTPEDNLLIYFSGHGEYKESIETGFWIPVDGKLNNIGSFLAFNLFTKYIRAIPTRHTVVIADSCYAGSMFTERRLSPRDQALRRLYGIPSRWLLTAGRNEVVSDGKPGDNSPFANSLLWHLKNHEEDAFSISDLSQRVTTDVSSNARQMPRGEPIVDVGHRGGEFIFVRRGYEAFFEGVERVPQPREGERRNAPPATGPPAGGGQGTAPPPPEAREEGPFTSIDEVRQSLQRHLMANDIERVFALFDQVLGPSSSLVNELILTQARYSSLQRERNAGLLLPQQIELRANQIRNALLYHVERLDTDDLKPDALQVAEPEVKGPDGKSEEALRHEARVLRKKIDFLKEEIDQITDAQQRVNLKVQMYDAEERLDEIQGLLGE